jgi:hypothetical protein
MISNLRSYKINQCMIYRSTAVTSCKGKDLFHATKILKSKKPSLEFEIVLYKN